MKAKKKPLDTLTPEELSVDASPRTETLKVSPPPERAAGVIVESVDELIDKLSKAIINAKNNLEEEGLWSE